MVKHWVQPSINKLDCHLEAFFRVSQVLFLFVLIIKMFIGIFGESFEIQLLAISYINLNKGFNQT